jgi:hypothetical protein
LSTLLFLFFRFEDDRFFLKLADFKFLLFFAFGGSKITFDDPLGVEILIEGTVGLAAGPIVYLDSKTKSLIDRSRLTSGVHAPAAATLVEKFLSYIVSPV